MHSLDLIKCFDGEKKILLKIETKEKKLNFDLFETQQFNEGKSKRQMQWPRLLILKL